MRKLPSSAVLRSTLCLLCNNDAIATYLESRRIRSILCLHFDCVNYAFFSMQYIKKHPFDEMLSFKKDHSYSPWNFDERIEEKLPSISFRLILRYYHFNDDVSKNKLTCIKRWMCTSR